MSKIVISGYYGFNNAGDEALLTAILAALRAVEPTVDITVISGNPGNTIAKHQVKSLYRFAAVRLLRAIREADLVISGGGSLLQDVTSKRSLAYYLSVIAAAKWKRKKVMLFAQGIGPIRSRAADPSGCEPGGRDHGAGPGFGRRTGTYGRSGCQSRGHGGSGADVESGIKNDGESHTGGSRSGSLQTDHRRFRAGMAG